MKNHAIYFYLMTDDSCILFYRVRYCISYRTENKLFYFILFYLFYVSVSDAGECGRVGSSWGGNVTVYSSDIGGSQHCVETV
jgi:hypothetical protein